MTHNQQCLRELERGLRKKKTEGLLPQVHSVSWIALDVILRLLQQTFAFNLQYAFSLVGCLNIATEFFLVKAYPECWPQSMLVLDMACALLP